jgi:hypothetical protein
MDDKSVKSGWWTEDAERIGDFIKERNEGGCIVRRAMQSKMVDWRTTITVNEDFFIKPNVAI